MDSSPPPQPNFYPYTTTTTTNWLGFSLNQPPPDLPLFHPYFPHPPPPGNSFQRSEPDAAGGGAGDYTTAPAPKLEDFLGGSGIYSGPGASAAFYGAADRAKRVEAVDEGLDLLHGGFMAAADYITTTTTDKSRAPLVVSETPPPVKKTPDSFGHRTSIYRGVTRHRWTGRYEAHLWDNSCKREGQSRKGRQVYLGGYDKEERAARAYDLAALKYWGATTTTNFPVSNYEKELDDMKHMTRQEFVASLRRKSSGFSRGASMYRGVTRHHQHGRWQARIGRVAGNKDLYLGTFSTQEEAAEAYDIAAIKFRGGNAVTNFDISRYDVNSIATRNLPVGGLSNKSSATLKPTPSGSVSASVEAGSKHSVSNVGFAPYHFSSSSSTLSFALGPTEQAGCWPVQSARFSLHDESRVSSGGFFGYVDQKPVNDSQNVTLNVPFAVPEGSEYGGGDSGSVCATKSSLSALHTLIFGME